MLIIFKDIGLIFVMPKEISGFSLTSIYSPLPARPFKKEPSGESHRHTKRKLKEFISLTIFVPESVLLRGDQSTLQNLPT